MSLPIQVVVGIINLSAMCFWSELVKDALKRLHVWRRREHDASNDPGKSDQLNLSLMNLEDSRPELLR